MSDLPNELSAGTIDLQTNPTLDQRNLDALSVREMQLLQLVCEGLTTKAIAARLKINFKTAACRQNQLFQKLHATSRFSAVRSAVRDGMIAA